MWNRPSLDDSVVYFSFFDPNDELLWTVSNSFLEIFNQLLGILAEVYVDTLCFCLQNAVFVDQNKPHGLLTN